MKRDHGLVFHIFLMFGDLLAILLSFLLAYFMRTHLDQRPFFFEADPWKFIFIIATLLPVYLIVLSCFGLYKRSIFLRQSRWSEVARLFLASIVGMMAIITLDFFFDIDLFPVRIMAVYAAVICFALLLFFRMTVRYVRRFILRFGKHSTLRAVIIGNHDATEYLSNYIAGYPESGFSLAGIVANSKYIPADLKKKQYSSLKEALRKGHPDVIFQTDERGSEYVYRQALNRHLAYYYVPSSADLSSQMGHFEFIGGTPTIFVPVTPLAGSGRIAKRACDIIIGGLLFILALIPMAIIWIIEKLSDIHAPALYSELRLSRYNRKVRIYKFRSMKTEYCGLSPEEAFKKMRRPELIKKYRKNGDYLKDDPRITRLGRFLRATSLDELPQLYNVLKGDIALVGPRALVPGELRHYGDRSLLLSVKSGLTGLAQVSGRRDIGFEERRALDIYYIQNWSLHMDFSILLRTIAVVLLRRGAK